MYGVLHSRPRRAAARRRTTAAAWTALRSSRSRLNRCRARALSLSAVGLAGRPPPGEQRGDGRVGGADHHASRRSQPAPVERRRRGARLGPPVPAGHERCSRPRPGRMTPRACSHSVRTVLGSKKAKAADTTSASTGPSTPARPPTAEVDPAEAQLRRPRSYGAAVEHEVAGDGAHGSGGGGGGLEQVPSSGNVADAAPTRGVTGPPAYR